MPPKKKKKVATAARKPQIQKKKAPATPTEPTDLEYQNLFDTCVITKEKVAEVDKLIEEKVVANRKIYEDISNKVSGRGFSRIEPNGGNLFNNNSSWNPLATVAAEEGTNLLTGVLPKSRTSTTFGSLAQEGISTGLDWLNPFNIQPLSQFFAGASIPWYFIACIHHLESSFNFKGHLHNGDPLTALTVQVPSGRPKVNHGPPFTFEESAVDALKFKGFDKINSWKLAVILRNLEKYNGFGYFRYRKINTPYLWSYSGHYTKGKYTSDGKYDSNAVSKQMGSAVILKRMEEKGTIYIPRF
jgi:lysozyme family protein